MSTRGFHTITLGCKLNQFDTAAMEGELTRRGFRSRDHAAGADVVIINTCTVTHRADADARKLIRAVRRANPECQLLVTGCFAERDPGALAGLPGVDRVFGNGEKPELAAILDDLGLAGSPRAATAAPGGDRGCDAALRLPQVLHFGHRSRAFLKIQEGCRLACAYCVIPSVRGASRSVAPEDVLSAAVELWASGYHEIVLTGVNTGDYGRDLSPRTDLLGLLGLLLAAAGPHRIRLNSLEPLTLTDGIIDCMKQDPRLCPHVQVPLQAGANAVLRRMRRNYTRHAYLDRVRQLRSAVPHAGLGADVMVGFPGETDALFEETYEFIAASPLNYLHVFSWSDRPGTAAAAMGNRLPERVIAERSRRLRALSRELWLRFRRGFVGQELDAVVLGSGKAPDRIRALTGNYIDVSLGGDTPSVPRQACRVRIENVTDDGTLGALIQPHRIEGPPVR